MDGREIRSAIRSAAVGGGATRDRAEDLTLASWEVVLNAIEHGGGRPEITIGAACRRVTVLIADPGSCWVGADAELTAVEHPLAPRGRGQRMIRALVDEVRRFQGPAASYVELTIRLPG